MFSPGENSSYGPKYKKQGELNRSMFFVTKNKRIFLIISSIQRVPQT